MWPRKPPPHLPDADKERHPGWRRYTRRYQRKQRLVRDIWIGAGLVMIALPLGPLLILLLATTFLAFTILDETRE